MSLQSAVQSVSIEAVQAHAYTVPTDLPEADGTLAWNDTSIVIANISSGELHGLGYTYNHPAAAELINTVLATAIEGLDAMDVQLAWHRMAVQTRNMGSGGLVAAAIAAVDTALWDLKAKALGLPLSKLWGQLRDSVPVYGSGGFTSYSPQQLQAQLGNWAAQGLPWVKMKIGTHPDEDVERVRLARAAIGPKLGLFVDANGAYDGKQALRLAQSFAAQDVRWFEEPVSSDDLTGLRLLRKRLPPAMQVAAGEYGDSLAYFQRMLAADAVDVLQADVTRCGGYTGFLRVGALAQAWQTPLSAHTAPSLHLPVCCALPAICHIEYFHDHVRIEQMFFDGAAQAEHGLLRPHPDRPGIGLTLRTEVAQQYQL